jgi:hypothetical protein
MLDFLQICFSELVSVWSYHFLFLLPLRFVGFSHVEIIIYWIIGLLEELRYLRKEAFISNHRPHFLGFWVYPWFISLETCYTLVVSEVQLEVQLYWMR